MVIKTGILVFRKSLWKKCMLEEGCTEQDLQQYTWPDAVDNLAVEGMASVGSKLVGTIGAYVILPQWCELVVEEEEK